MSWNSMHPKAKAKRAWGILLYQPLDPLNFPSKWGTRPHTEGNFIIFINLCTFFNPILYPRLLLFYLLQQPNNRLTQRQPFSIISPTISLMLNWATLFCYIFVHQYYMAQILTNLCLIKNGLFTMCISTINHYNYYFLLIILGRISPLWGSLPIMIELVYILRVIHVDLLVNSHHRLPVEFGDLNSFIYPLPLPLIWVMR